MQIKAKKITEITLIDPDTHFEVQVTIYKEEGGGMFGVDSSFLANTDLPVYSPFIRGRVVKIEEEENPPVIVDDYTPRIKPGSPEFIALQQEAIREQNKVYERMNDQRPDFFSEDDDDEIYGKETHKTIHLEEEPQTYEVLVYSTKEAFESHKADDTYEDFPTKAIAMKFVEEKKKGSYYAIKVQSEDREDIEIFLKQPLPN